MCTFQGDPVATRLHRGVDVLLNSSDSFSGIFGLAAGSRLHMSEITIAAGYSMMSLLSKFGRKLFKDFYATWPIFDGTFTGGKSNGLRV